MRIVRTRQRPRHACERISASRHRARADALLERSRRHLPGRSRGLSFSRQTNRLRHSRTSLQEANIRRMHVRSSRRRALSSRLTFHVSPLRKPSLVHAVVELGLLLAQSPIAAIELTARKHRITWFDLRQSGQVDESCATHYASASAAPFAFFAFARFARFLFSASTFFCS